MTVLLLITSCSTIKEETYFRQQKGLYCYDGDTCYIIHKGAKELIRIRNLDTPEIKGKCIQEKQLAIKARDYINKRIKNAKSIRFERLGRDYYNRILGDIYIDNWKISIQVIQKGLGKEYRKGIKINWCD